MNLTISIVLKINEKEFLRSSYMWLEPYAPNSGRKFVFSGVEFKKSLVNWDDRINVDITVFNGQNKPIFSNKFEIFVLNFDSDNLCQSEWWVYGNVFNVDETEYRQGKIEAFNTWQNGKQFDWFSLPVHSQFKLDYISACLDYSGIREKMIKKDVCQFDMSLIKEERDFFYLASLEFMGDRGYFGHDFYTFEDCLLIIFNHHGYFNDKRIAFLNIDKIYSIEMAALFEDLKKVFLKYQFSID